MHNKSIWLIWRDDYHCTEASMIEFSQDLNWKGEWMWGRNCTDLCSTIDLHLYILILEKSWNFLSGCILFYFYLYQKFEVIHVIIIMVKIVTVLESLMALIRAWLFFLIFQLKHKIFVSIFLLPTNLYVSNIEISNETISGIPCYNLAAFADIQAKVDYSNV